MSGQYETVASGTAVFGGFGRGGMEIAGMAGAAGGVMAGSGGMGAAGNAD